MHPPTDLVATAYSEWIWQHWTLLGTWFQAVGASGGIAAGQNAPQAQQRRNLVIHEYLAMNILRENGVQVPKFSVADNAAEAFKIASDFGIVLSYNNILILKFNLVLLIAVQWVHVIKRKKCLNLP